MVTETELRRSIIPNDHWGRCLGFSGIGVGLVDVWWPLLLPFACGAVYHFVRWQQDLAKARKARKAEAARPVDLVG